MIDRFPYGKAPFWLTAIAVSSLLVILVTQHLRAERAPDLVLALSASNHMAAYGEVRDRFEQKHGVKVALQLVQDRALQTRLQNALLAGTDVPDLVEIPADSMTFLARGPLSDVGVVDLTERLSQEGYRERLVESRLSLWSSRGHVFALPHDVHPVLLFYRTDLMEQLGINVEELETWDDFARVGREITKDNDGDGVIDRYMIDLPLGGGHGLNILMLQRGVGLFDEDGNVSFNQELTVDTMIWYLKQTYGPTKIAFECGWGQSLAKCMYDGLALFYIMPDWRSLVTETEAPKLAGKGKLMPLPAWEKGGRRTSVWGGSGLAITKQSPHQELAWEFAKELYFHTPDLGKRFAMTNIIPPFKDAWDLPEFKKPNPYYSGQALGELYARYAPETPPLWSTPYRALAEAKVNEAFLRAAARYQSSGEDGLREFIAQELDAAQAYVERAMARNVLAKLERKETP